MANMLKKVIPIADSFKTWLTNTFSQIGHTHSSSDVTGIAVYDSRPDWSRAIEYVCGVSYDASTGNIFKINADGYIFATGTHRYHKYDGTNSATDCDLAFVASTAIEALIVDAEYYQYDLVYLLGINASGDTNNFAGAIAVRKSHPWYLRYHCDYNDILGVKLMFVPCVSQETTTYLQLVYDNSSAAVNHYSRFEGDPANCILSSNGYKIINFKYNTFVTGTASTGKFGFFNESISPAFLEISGLTYAYYGVNTANVTVDGVTYVKYTYKYSTTGASTSGDSTYAYTKDTTMTGYNSSYNYKYLNTLNIGFNELWIENVGTKWRYVLHTRYKDTVPTTDRAGTSSSDYVSTVSDKPAYATYVVRYETTTNSDYNQTYFDSDSSAHGQCCTYGSTTVTRLSDGTSSTVYTRLYYWLFTRYYTVYSTPIDFGTSTRAISRFANILFSGKSSTIVVDKRKSPITYPTTSTFPLDTDGFNKLSSAPPDHVASYTSTTSGNAFEYGAHLSNV